MKKLNQLLNLRKTNGRFGVEVEVEGDRLVFPPPDNWISVPDGSLRGGYPNNSGEYVFAKPLSYDKTLESIKELKAAMEGNNAFLNFSFRTSVHVHVNVQDFNWNEYAAFLYTSLLLENVLVHYCGPVREGNRFCLRVQDAEAFVDTLFEVFKGGHGVVSNLQENHIRYSAINIAATRKYGSVEFRMMRGTLDVDALSTWITALNNIHLFCFNKTPRKVHDLFVKNHPEDFLKIVLNDVADKFTYDRTVDDLRQAFSLTLQLPYVFVSAEEHQRIQEEKDRRARKLYEQAIKDQEVVKVAPINRVVIDEPRAW